MRILMTTIAALALSIGVFAQGSDLSNLRPTSTEPIAAMKFANAPVSAVVVDETTLRVVRKP